MSKYGHRAHNWFEAIVNKLGGMDGALKFLRDELSVSEPTRSWRKENGIIYFSVKSDGTTGPEWVKRLEEKGSHVGDWAERLLCSPAFQPTSGITTHMVVLPGTLWNDDERITSVIRAEAKRRKLGKPNAEAACLIREMFSDEEMEAMGLWHIVAMHEPIKDSDGVPSLLDAGRRGGGRWLSACYDRPDGGWYRGGGFAFAVSPQ